MSGPLRRDPAARAARAGRRGRRTRAYGKNAIIVTEGDETGSLYVLLSGRVKVYLSDSQGKEVSLNQLRPGEYFG